MVVEAQPNGKSGQNPGGRNPISWHEGENAVAERLLVAPPHLSPSSMGTFTSCPLSFRSA